MDYTNLIVDNDVALRANPFVSSTMMFDTMAGAAVRHSHDALGRAPDYSSLFQPTAGLPQQGFSEISNGPTNQATNLNFDGMSLFDINGTSYSLANDVYGQANTFMVPSPTDYVGQSSNVMAFHSHSQFGYDLHMGMNLIAQGESTSMTQPRHHGLLQSVGLSDPCLDPSTLVPQQYHHVSPGASAPDAGPSPVVKDEPMDFYFLPQSISPTPSGYLLSSRVSTPYSYRSGESTPALTPSATPAPSSAGPATPISQFEDVEEVAPMALAPAADVSLPAISRGHAAYTHRALSVKFESSSPFSTPPPPAHRYSTRSSISGGSRSTTRKVQSSISARAKAVTNLKVERSMVLKKKSERRTRMIFDREKGREVLKYGCDLCDSWFCRHPDLNRHERSAHMDGDLSCRWIIDINENKVPGCGRTFKRRDAQERHLRESCPIARQMKKEGLLQSKGKRRASLKSTKP